MKPENKLTPKEEVMLKFVQAQALLLEVGLELETLLLDEKDRTVIAKDFANFKAGKTPIHSDLKELLKKELDGLNELLKDEKKEAKMVECTYDQKNNILTLDKPESDFDKRFLKYMLERMGLPADAIIKFSPEPDTEENTNEN